MTATPIPRTLALTAYGDLDVTALRAAARRAAARSRRTSPRPSASASARTSASARSCAPGARRSSSARSSRSPRRCRRAPRPPSSSGCATTELEDFRVVLLHGQMRPREKQEAMAAFAAGGADVLVATTVIEVGIDVPERDRDARRGRRALRHLAAAPAARPDRPRRARVGLPAVRPEGVAAAARARRAPRRLPAGRDRPRAARRGRADRHAPVGPGAVPRRAAARGRASCSTRARRDRPRRCSRPTRSCSSPSTRCSAGPCGRPTAPRRSTRSRREPARRSPAATAGAGCRRRPAPRTRPTSDRVREALFSILGALDGARVLDLFAGSGALGLEALSRGAARARRSSRARRPRCGAPGQPRGARRRRAEVRARRARARSATHPRRRRQYDLVFLDPPYRRAAELGARALGRCCRRCSRRGRWWSARADRRAPLELTDPAHRRTPLRRHPDPHPCRLTRPPHIAVCPGSYDPITNGHLDVITRAAEIFDEVIVAVVNASVRKDQHAVRGRGAHRLRRARDAPISATSGPSTFDVLIVEFARRVGAKAIVKGLRAISDFEYELEMNQLNRHQADDIESVYLMASPQYSFLSSSGVKELATFGGDIYGPRPRRRREALEGRARPLTNYGQEPHGRPRSHRQAGRPRPQRQAASR